MTDHGRGILEAVEAAFREHFGLAPDRASVSFVGVEPIEVLRYPDGDRAHYASLGMSRYPMADPGELVVDAATAPRAELLITATGQPDDLWRHLAVLAAAPAVEGSVYSVGNRVDLGEPLTAGSRCTGGIFADGPLQPIAVAGIANVVVFEVLPATATELAWARVHGTEALLQRWHAAGTELADLTRDAVALD